MLALSATLQKESVFQITAVCFCLQRWRHRKLSSQGSWALNQADSTIILLEVVSCSGNLASMSKSSCVSVATSRYVHFGSAELSVFKLMRIGRHQACFSSPAHHFGIQNYSECSIMKTDYTSLQQNWLWDTNITDLRLSVICHYRQLRKFSARSI
jgi:hypothetical protein